MGCLFVPSLPEIGIGESPTPSQTLTPLPTLTPTITPTALPVARVGIGDHALFNGDFESALVLYQTSFQDSPDADIQAAAKWGEARVYFARDQYDKAISTLQELITGYPNSIHFADAYFLQGFAQYRLSNFQAAADSWQTYLTLRPGILDSYTQELRGDALFNAEDYPSALTAYRAAIQDPHLGDSVFLDMKVASTFGELGDVESAVSLYDGVAARATSDYVKAQAAYETGIVYQDHGLIPEAQGKFRLAIENYPLSYYSYLSLIELLNSGGEVSDLDRGLVDYFAGQYDVAIAAFQRYIASTPSNDGTAYYFLAQSYRNLGDYNSALDYYQTFINNYSGNSRWVDAWGEKAYLEWFYLGSYSVAAQTLLDFVQAVPNSDASADYLMSAARIYERDGQYDRAVDTWNRVTTEYPGTQDAVEATFLMGIIHYRLKDFTGALDLFTRESTLATLPSDQARAYLWIGKAQEQLSNQEEALNNWRAAQDKDPGGYYSERARDLLGGLTPFSPPPSTNLQPDMVRLRADADAWMRLTFNLPADTDLSGLGDLAGDPRIIRGTALWNLGFYEDARVELEDIRVEKSTDPVATYRLSNYLLDLGLYRSAIFAARQTLTLAGLDEHTESMMAPPYFSYVRYGLYYQDLVIPQAEKNGFEPLFLFSVIRQESLFEGFVQSTAGARGLLQIVPSTGAQINNKLGWPIEYTDDDLYRPIVSVTFGAHYLADNRNGFNGDLYAALAAYNGGPGNAVAWKELSGDDPDLFLESIRFQETRDYIRNIFEIYAIYRRIYSAGAQ